MNSFNRKPGIHWQVNRNDRIGCEFALVLTHYKSHLTPRKEVLRDTGHVEQTTELEIVLRRIGRIEALACSRSEDNGVTLFSAKTERALADRHLALKICITTHALSLRLIVYVQKITLGWEECSIERIVAR